MKKASWKHSRVILAVLVTLAAPVAAGAGDNGREAILAAYAAEAKASDPSFSGFSANRGETLFRSVRSGGDERTPSCTSCHTGDPRAPGRNAKTGRRIDPVAVSANARRFTEGEKVEKHFARDCKSVLGRPCTVLEKGDYITFLEGQ
ncbi:MAG: DUF1924 domain-containing protein [Alphaproteobacteria bacterium]|nr:DUF1924 domain-containing protein [Alphaproteobacteria bacterium]